MLRQSEGPRRSKRNTRPSISVATSHTSNWSGKICHLGGDKRDGKEMSAGELANSKATQPCRPYGEVGHWSDAHSSEGSLNLGTPSLDLHAGASSGNINRRNQLGENNDFNKHEFGSQKKPSVICFTANITQDSNQSPHPSGTLICVSSVTTRPSNIGPIADYGPLYSSIGEAELRYHQKRLVGRSILFDQKPEGLQGFDFWQFGVGDHTCSCRQVPSSIVLHLLNDSSSQITVRHTLIEVLTQ